MTESWRPGTPILLKGKGFVLRSLLPRDVTETYLSWWNDEAVQNPEGLPARKWTRAHGVRHIRRFDNQRRFHLGIFPLEGQEDEPAKEPIGFISVFFEPGKKASSNALLGNLDFRGKGLLTEARRRVLEFAMQGRGCAKFHGRAMARNFAAIHSYRALGFACEGILKSHDVLPSGERTDVFLFGLLRENWLPDQPSKKVAAPSAKCKAVLAEACGLSAAEIPEDAAIGSFAPWNELAHERLILALEKRKGCLLTSEEIISIASAADLAGCSG